MKSKIFLVSIFIIGMGISLLILLDSLHLPSRYENEDLYQYEITKNANYQVFLKENPFFTSKTLGSDKLYIANLIDTIHTTFTYQYQANTVADLKYSYDIVATLIIDYQSTTPISNATIWTKQYLIITDKFLDLEQSNQFVIQEPITIDYNLYRREVEQFKDSFSLPITALLKLEFKVKSEAMLENTISEVANVSLSINLNDPIFAIMQSNTGNESGSVLKNGNPTGTINMSELITGIFLFSILFVSFFLLIRKYAKQENVEKSYLAILEGLKKNYSDILIEIKKPMDTKELQIFDVINFEQLIDLENEIRIPILCYEEEKQTTFMIVYNGAAYRYLLKELP